MAEEIVEQGYRELAETILEHNPGVDLGRVRAAFGKYPADLFSAHVHIVDPLYGRGLGSALLYGSARGYSSSCCDADSLFRRDVRLHKDA